MERKNAGRKKQKNKIDSDFENDLQLGQHFLEDLSVIEKSIVSAELGPGDIVLEIGPGAGALTCELAKLCHKVIAVELDSRLEGKHEKFPDNVQVFYGDAVSNILDLKDKYYFNKIVSNIPYNISEPLFKKLIRIDFEVAVLLTGSNFYELLCENENGKLYHVSKLFFDIEKICDVSKDAFSPRPRVSSVLMKITLRKRELSAGENIMREFVLQSDKKVKNALVNAVKTVKGVSKYDATKEVEGLKLSDSILRQNVDHISNEEFLRIRGQLISYNS